MRVRVYARMYARAYDCDSQQDNTREENTHQRKREEGKPAYICIIADNEKKNKKSKKKFVSIIFCRTFVSLKGVSNGRTYKTPDRVRKTNNAK